jgi:hypothetical protein
VFLLWLYWTNTLSQKKWTRTTSFTP